MAPLVIQVTQEYPGQVHRVIQASVDTRVSMVPLVTRVSTEHLDTQVTADTQVSMEHQVIQVHLVTRVSTVHLVTVDTQVSVDTQE